jgi:hypothetical protein
MKASNFFIFIVALLVLGGLIYNNEQTEKPAQDTVPQYTPAPKQPEPEPRPRPQEPAPEPPRKPAPPARPKIKPKITLTHGEGFPQLGDLVNLYKGSYQLIYKLIRTEQDFYLENNRYATMTEDLNIVFTQQTDIFEGINTKVRLNNGYLYTISDDSVTVSYEGSDNPYSAYYLEFYFAGEGYCISKNTSSGLMCRELGGVNSKLSDDRASIVYELPKDFLSGKIRGIKSSQ